MKKIAFALLLLCNALLVAPVSAADGSVCYSGTMAYTATGTIGSTTQYPQLGNGTTFVCGFSTATYTIRQLSQAGWIIVSVQPTALSTTMNSDGTATSRHRIMLVIQK